MKDPLPIVAYSDFGRFIQELRKTRGMTGAKLGKLVNISQSTISKIENGHVVLTTNEAEKILNILQCPKRIQQQLLATLEINTKPYGKYRFIAPNEVFPREAKTLYLRSFLFTGPHVLLQVTAFREAYLKNQRLSEVELKRQLSETVRRRELLWDSKRHFHFLMPEAALYTTMNDALMQQAQLDGLSRLIGHKRIRIGIIPNKAGFLPVENSSFVLYDNTTIVTISADSEEVSHDPERIAEHFKIFSRLERKATYDSEAAAIVHEAYVFFDKGLARRSTEETINTPS